MKCPKCQFENREEAKFCIACGEGLSKKCPQCNCKLPLSARFCDECGYDLNSPIPESSGPSTYDESGKRDQKPLPANAQRIHSSGTNRVPDIFLDILVRPHPQSSWRPIYEGFEGPETRTLLPKTKFCLFVIIFYALLISYLLVQLLHPHSALARAGNIFGNFWLDFAFLGVCFLIISWWLYGVVDFSYRTLLRMKWNRSKVGEKLMYGGYITKKELKEALGEQRLRLGEILVQEGLITRSQLEETLAQQGKGSKKLGEILRDQGHASEEEIKWALKKMDRKLGEILREKGLVTDYDLQWALAGKDSGKKIRSSL